MRDNWDERSGGRLCGTCMFFVTKRSKEWGKCRRNPPIPVFNCWSTVFPDEGCGEYVSNDWTRRDK